MEKRTNIKLSILIVHYKTPELTYNCIEALGYNKDWEIIVVDNDSQDGASTKILNDFPHVNWIPNEKNEGFGRANNTGIIAAKGEFVLLLNSDVIATPEAIEKCLVQFTKQPDCGVLGCRILYPDLQPQNSTYYHNSDFKGLLKLNHFYSKWYRRPQELKAVMGSFMLLRKKEVVEIGLFDTDFFMYCEEIELCQRYMAMGYKIDYYEAASVIHEHGGSSKSSNNWSVNQNMLSQALYFRKTRGVVGLLVYNTIMIINYCSSLLFRLLKPNQNYSADEQLYPAFFGTFKFLLKILFKYKGAGRGQRDFIKYE